MRTSIVVLAVLFVGCGDADATVGEGQLFAAEEEVASTGDALLSNAARVWLPMQEGNTWTFASSTGATRTITYSGVEDGVAWLDGLSRNGEWVGLAASAPNTLYAWSDDLSAWEPLYRFGYAVTSWSIGAGCDKFTLRRTATDATVAVPAGTFTGARTIGYTHNPPLTARCVVPALSSVTFAPNVGPVMLVTGGGEKLTLQSARVGGKTWPAPVAGTLTAKLTFDRASYTNRSNTIVCITTPCPGNAVTAEAKFTYSITNGTAAAKTWQFSSGCQYDLSLTDSTGKVVRTLSEDRACTLALTSFTLAPGQTKTFSGSVALATVAGAQLEGGLTGRATLLGAPSTPASASFSVSIVPAVP